MCVCVCMHLCVCVIIGFNAFIITVVFFLLELKDFLSHVTGTTVLYKESIKTDFMDSDDIGAISALTAPTY